MINSNNRVSKIKDTEVNCMADTIIKSDYLLLEDGLKLNWGVRIENNRIVEVAPNENIKIKNGDKTINFKNKILAPDICICMVF